MKKLLFALFASLMFAACGGSEGDAKKGDASGKKDDAAHSHDGNDPNHSHDDGKKDDGKKKD